MSLPSYIHYMDYYIGRFAIKDEEKPGDKLGSVVPAIFAITLLFQEQIEGRNSLLDNTRTYSRDLLCRHGLAQKIKY